MVTMLSHGRVRLQDTQVLEEDADLPLTEIAKRVGLFSASAISKRIKRLKEEGYIKGFRAVIDYERLGFSFKTVTFVRARYGKDYNNRIGNWLRDMPACLPYTSSLET